MMTATRNNRKYCDWNTVFAMADACTAPLVLSMPDEQSAERITRAGWHASHTVARGGKWELTRRGTDVYVRRAA